MRDTSVDSRRRQMLEQLAEFRAQRMTFAECAKTLRMSERQLRRWAKEPAYKEVMRELQQEWREVSQAAVKSLGSEAIAVLRELMLSARSEHVRFEAARTIGDWAKISEEEEDKVQDDREELNEIYRLLAERKQVQPPQVNIALPPGSLIRTPGSSPQLKLIEGSARVVDGEE